MSAPTSNFDLVRKKLEYYKVRCYGDTTPQPRETTIHDHVLPFSGDKPTLHLTFTVLETIPGHAEHDIRGFFDGEQYFSTSVSYDQKAQRSVPTLRNKHKQAIFWLNDNRVEADGGGYLFRPA